MEWSIQQVARIAGTTSRTLRHYGELGLVAPSRIGANGYRFYDEQALMRLQQVLLFRELGLGLSRIREIVDRETDGAQALIVHLGLLRQEQDRLARQVAAVEHTINSLKGSEKLMAENMFDGFDHTQYRDEVEERWGKDAYADSDAWWRSLSAADKKNWQEELQQLNKDWIAARDAGLEPDSAEAQELAHRHVAWLQGVPGTPADFGNYVAGLAEMYVADERFAVNYGGKTGAELVRDALLAHLRQQG